MNQFKGEISYYLEMINNHYSDSPNWMEIMSVESQVYHPFGLKQAVFPVHQFKNDKEVKKRIQLSIALP